VSYKTAIQNALVQYADAATFPAAVYSTDRPSLLSEGDAVPAASIEANELRADFDVDPRQGRKVALERRAWQWALRLRFDQEVVLEQFETALAEAPPVVLRDVSDGRPYQVRLMLDDSSYEHPPRGGASNGTKAVFRFVAVICN
jgi:hypothetical protein